jgi:GDPmannose 4,6-dehydratase
MKRALITGITGQDGSYLAELLLEKGYEVHGIVRRVALEDPLHRLRRLVHIKDSLQLHCASMESYASLYETVAAVRPEECYHLAAQSFVAYSFDDEFSTLNTNINGTHYLFSAIKNVVPSCRIYFAASSEMFGNPTEVPQTETTPFRPRSPYGISKLTGFHITRNYREAYGLFACSGICFNHESPRRGFEFVTRKISDGVSRIKLGMADNLTLGNLDAKRDWGHAKDYVRAMWQMLQQDVPDDFVIATGESHSVRDFVAESFRVASLGPWEDFVEVDERFFRPAEINELIGDARKARKTLGWDNTTDFESLVREMVETDIERNRGGGMVDREPTF